MGEQINTTAKSNTGCGGIVTGDINPDNIQDNVKLLMEFVYITELRSSWKSYLQSTNWESDEAEDKVIRLSKHLDKLGKIINERCNINLQEIYDNERKETLD